MPEAFKGKINVDIRDSVPDWGPFEPPRAPEGAPSVVYIVLDDVGFSAMSCYGGPIATPNIDRIASQGVRFTQWHTTALCSPTRSCLLTGRNHTRNSMACITEAAIGFPNASGTVPPENGMLPEILGEQGWNTYMVGKWHLCPTDEMNLASTRRNWPSGRGFERWYGFLGAETNQWYPDLVYDNHPVDQPKSPEDGYHLTDDLTDKAIEFIQDAKAIAPEKPFFLYYAPGACHAPHHAPKDWIDKFKGQFDMGYEAMREETLARQKQQGLVPADTELPPLNPIGTTERTGPDGLPFPELDYTRPWDSLNDAEKRLFARMAEVYAGFLAHADHHIGRLLDYLEATEQLENTLVVVVSDNGASGEGGPNGSVNEMKFANGVPDDLQENLAKLDELGGTRTYNHYPNGWAMAFNTPFKMWKRYEFNGGTADPCIISWPAGLQPRGEIREQYYHAVDLVPTILDALGVEPPETIKGHTQSPFDGVSMRGSVEDATAPSGRSTQFYSMLGSRSIWHDGLEGGHHAPDDRGVGPLQRRRVGAVPRRRRPVRAAQPGRRGAGPVARADQHLVLGGRRERRVPARRPLCGRDPVNPTSPAHCGQGPLRLLPGHRSRPGVAGRQHPRSLVRDRRPRRHPGTRGRGSAVRDGRAVRRARALRQGQPAALREQLRRQRGADGRRIRGHPDRREPDPVGVVRQGGPGARRVRPGCCRCSTATRRSASSASRRSWVRSPSPGLRPTSAGTPESPSPTTTPARRRTRSPAARSTGSRSTSAVSRTSTSSVRLPSC